MADRIVVEGIRVEARHGVLAEERQRPQPFLVDLVIETDLAEAGASDRLEDTVDYAAVARRVAARVAEERWNLIERVAQRVAEAVLEDSKVRAVEVTVHKPEAPTPVTVGDVSVTIRRTR